MIERDFAVFPDKQLEALFEAILIESQVFNRIGSYWDTKGENEVDLIAIDDLSKRILMVEVKRQAKKYQPNKLLIKSAHVLDKLKLKNYQVELRCFSLDTLDEVIAEFTKPSFHTNL